MQIFAQIKPGKPSPQIQYDFPIAPVVVVAWLVDVRSGVVEVVRVTPFVAQRCFTLFHRHALSRLQTLSTNISGHVNSSLF